MSSIVTFYSYKGGVGRSMSLANIAYELAKRNKKVLMVDWDLEAPGLERYFSSFKIDNSAEGLLTLLLDYCNGADPDYKKYLWTININREQPLYLMHSGRENDPVKYSSNLEKFDWEYFFQTGQGGLHLEKLRNQWLKDFDIVLIDSRTGLSDSSGICTILLPDIVVPMFTANYQSLFGIRDIMKYIQTSRQKLSVDRMSLTILPVPSRFGTRVEFKESQEWLDRIADILRDCFSDWLPKWIEPRYILEQVKIPQVDYFSFGEKLAVVEQGTNDPEGMGFIYAKLADLLASDFTELEKFIGTSYYQKKKEDYNNNVKPKTAQAATNEFLYDLYISYPRDAYQWVRELLMPALTEYLNDELGYNPQIFFDFNEVNTNQSVSSTQLQAMEKSKVFLYVFSEVDPNNDFLGQELSFFQLGGRSVKNNSSSITIRKPTVIFPVMYKRSNTEKAELPLLIKYEKVSDFSSYNVEEVFKSAKLRTQFGNEVEKLAKEMSRSIKLISSDNNNKSQQFELGASDISGEIDMLALEYENLRKSLPSGPQRTRLMENVVSKMKERSHEAGSLLPILTKSTSPGKRLAAIVTLQEKPTVDYVDWLAEHVGDCEKPFVGYQASVALYIASRALGSSFKDKVADAVELALKNFTKYEYQDANQYSVLDAAKTELSLK